MCVRVLSESDVYYYTKRYKERSHSTRLCCLCAVLLCYVNKPAIARCLLCHLYSSSGLRCSYYIVLLYSWPMLYIERKVLCPSDSGERESRSDGGAFIWRWMRNCQLDLDVAYRHVCVCCVLCATVGVGSMWRSIHPRPAVQSSRVRCPGDTAALPVDDKSTNSNHQRSKLLHKRPSSNITPRPTLTDMTWAVYRIGPPSTREKQVRPMTSSSCWHLLLLFVRRSIQGSPSAKGSSYKKKNKQHVV